MSMALFLFQTLIDRLNTLQYRHPMKNLQQFQTLIDRLNTGAAGDAELIEDLISNPYR